VVADVVELLVQRALIGKDGLSMSDGAHSPVAFGSFFELARDAIDRAVVSFEKASFTNESHAIEFDGTLPAAIHANERTVRTRHLQSHTHASRSFAVCEARTCAAKVG
jgi:hypothetical protein